MNKIFLLGYVGKDPEIQKLKDSEHRVGRFTLATNEYYKNKDGEKVEQTEWFNILVWDKQADLVEEYVKKGSRLLIVGKMTSRSYEKDGETKFFSEVVCREFTFLDTKEGSPKKEHPNTPPNIDDDFNDVDDLPF